MSEKEDRSEAQKNSDVTIDNEEGISFARRAVQIFILLLVLGVLGWFAFQWFDTRRESALLAKNMEESRKQNPEQNLHLSLDEAIKSGPQQQGGPVSKSRSRPLNVLDLVPGLNDADLPEEEPPPVEMVEEVDPNEKKAKLLNADGVDMVLKLEQAEKAFRAYLELSPDKKHEKVRNPGYWKDAMSAYYAFDLKLPEEPDLIVNRLPFSVDEQFFVLLVMKFDSTLREAAMFYEQGEWRLDWASFVGYSQLHWSMIREIKPVQPTQIRAYAIVDQYYNFHFSNAKELLCVRLEDIARKHVIYGYVERDSEVGKELKAYLDGRLATEQTVNLEISYPRAIDAQDDQVRIVKILAKRWLDFE